MQKSLTIARLAGPVLSAIGIGMLANQATYREMATQFLAGLPFIYFSGVLMLVTGLYILNALTGVGAFRLIAPQFANFIATAIIANAGFFTGLGIFLVVFGGFITFKGYVA